MDSQTVKISGVDIALVQFGDCRHPPLLYLHGGLGPDQSTPFLKELAKQYYVLAPHHPGFGISSWPKHIRSVSDLAFFYLDLVGHLGLRETVLVGACFGGWLAAEILIRSTERFSHVVLIDALGAKFGDRLSRDITDIHSLSEDEVCGVLYHNPAHAIRDYGVLSDDALNRIARNREAFAFFGWKPYMHDSSLKTWLHRINIPALLLWGKSDGFVSVDYAEKYAEAIPDSQLQLVDEAGHYPQVERPEIVCDHIYQFIGSRKT